MKNNEYITLVQCWFSTTYLHSFCHQMKMVKAKWALNAYNLPVSFNRAVKYEIILLVGRGIRVTSICPDNMQLCANWESNPPKTDHKSNAQPAAEAYYSWSIVQQHIPTEKVKFQPLKLNLCNWQMATTVLTVTATVRYLYCTPTSKARVHYKTKQHVPWCPNTDSNKNVSVFCIKS